jgi:hypothetical protein
MQRIIFTLLCTAIAITGCGNSSSSKNEKEIQMSSKSQLETVNKYLNIIFVENKNGEGLTDILTDSFMFDDPFTKATGAKDFIAKTQKWIRTKKTFHMQNQFTDDNKVCSIYIIDVLTPSGETASFELVDNVEFANGKIAKEKVYFSDPVKFAKKMGFINDYLKPYF